MKLKTLSLVSCSFITLFLYVPHVYSKGTIKVDENETPRVFHCQMPERYSHLKALKNAALRDARLEAQRVNGSKRVGFRDTIEIQTSDLLEVARPNLKLEEVESLDTSFQDPQKHPSEKTRGQAIRHGRGETITNAEQFFKTPLTVRAHVILNNLINNKVLEEISVIELGQLLKWCDFAVHQQDNEQGVILQKKIIDQLKERYRQNYRSYERQRLKKVDSENENPCLPKQVPLFPFAGDKLKKNEKWKQQYMQASRLLVDNPLSSKAKRLLLSVTKAAPEFKDAYFRLYVIEDATGNKEVARNYLQEAASGTQGLAVAKYQMGLQLLSEEQEESAKNWFMEASAQKYWFADREIMNLYAKKIQEIAVALKPVNF